MCYRQYELHLPSTPHTQETSYGKKTYLSGTITLERNTMDSTLESHETKGCCWLWDAGGKDLGVQEVSFCIWSRAAPGRNFVEASPYHGHEGKEDSSELHHVAGHYCECWFVLLIEFECWEGVRSRYEIVNIKLLMVVDEVGRLSGLL